MSRTYYISLMVTVLDEDPHPDTWDWSVLGDDVTLEDVQEVGE